MLQSRSREGAWIEILRQDMHLLQISSRSREGAWIEIARHKICTLQTYVAPVRERGLKYHQVIRYHI